MQTTNGGKGYSGTAGAMRNNPQYIPSGNSNSSSNNNSSNNNSTNNNSNSNNDDAEITSSWMPASKCFPEIYYQVKTRYPNHPRNYKHDGTYSVWIKFKNVGGKGVKFWVKINVPNSTGGELDLNNQLAPGEIDQNGFSEVHTTVPPSSINVNVYKATYNLTTTNYIECINGVLTNSNNNTNQTNNSNTSNTQQNDLTEYNRSKADLERQMQQKNQEIANSNAEAQRQQQLLKQQQEQQRQQQIQQGINQITTATVDLVTYFATRNNALRNSLGKEDGQALLNIVNSENPTNYTQNVIQIFTDLGYTLRKTETKNGATFITMNNDVNNINDLLFVFIHPASYDYYNRISFSYYRKQKLKEQLAVLGANLKDLNDLELSGISPSNQQKKAEKDKKNLDEKTIRINGLINQFEKYDYWNSTGRDAFDYAKDIAEAYEDVNALNNKSEAIRYYKKAATISIEDLSAPYVGKSDYESMRKFYEEKLADIYFKIGYLCTNNDGNEAIKWYSKCSDLLPGPNVNIALIYRNGVGGVKMDWNLAKEYYEKAAEAGSSKAMYSLGKLYREGGFGLVKDESKSKKWFRKACKEDSQYCN
jgi:TPR repeat protein